MIKRSFVPLVFQSSTPTSILIEENPKSKMQRTLELCATSGNRLMSKSNMDPDSAFVKLQVDDCECSSSSAPFNDISASDQCVSFLKHHQVPERRHSRTPTDVRNNILCYLSSCKVCHQTDSTLKMLICDLCEECFHFSCCCQRLKEVPGDEWFCDSCFKKILKESSPRKSIVNISGPIVSMLGNFGPYMSNVRIGKDFQAEVFDWSSPIFNDLDDYFEPVEIDSVECGSHQDQSSTKQSRISSIGNWLQCQEVIDGDGTICGKWRRAPLFEVQTKDWECFCAVLWDPAHADCAVPQELETDQVLKQLEFIERLRPRLTGKKCKLDVNEGVNLQ